MRSLAWLMACTSLVTVGCAADPSLPVFVQTSNGPRACASPTPAHPSGPTFSDDPYRTPEKELSESLRRTAQQVRPSLVSLRALPMSQSSAATDVSGTHRTSASSWGTGVIISADGVILTTAHVVRASREIVVTLADGSEHVVQEAALDENLDLAALRIAKIDLFSLDPVTASVDVGTPVVAVSAYCPGSEECLRTGVVTNPCKSLQDDLDPGRTRQYSELIESTTDLQPGYSGSPLVDLQARFVGVNVAVVDGQERDGPRGYAIPFNSAARDAIARLAAKVVAKRTAPLQDRK